ncbi:hypothetical protein DYBT9275_00162 [Dyadobacter sp. CECT 9275]|uniref:Cytochrome c domain-containing protein n=1 Tax=Dyadobacter helix TaxID=2822344 RepID=A0A916J6J0_9BACT|nr:c-type cytochrome [Dyadobacter sp. CECT 9275]CAG4988808.1 hypothetical protein DYBT9275_00162 [Dyadobacter sp. CECT 9275]
MKAIQFLAVLFFAGLFVTPVVAQENKSQSVRTKVNTPEQEQAGFKLAEGFVIELVASEKDSVVNPIDLTFDDAGRLWTQTARMYPLDPVADIEWDDLLRLMDDQEAQKKHPSFQRILSLYQGKTKGKDKILILSDLYGDEQVKTTVWADGLTIPMSILPYKNGAYVAQGSELFFLNDHNKDGKADQRTPLFTGFGFTDTHTMAHVLVRAPGGWINFSHGALNKGEVSSLKSNVKLKIDYSKIARFSLDGSKLELVNNGLNNIWGFQLRGNGQWYGSEANDLGYSVTPMEPGSGFPGIGNEHLRPYQPFVPALHDFRVGGTGISGTAFADDAARSFPKEYKDVAFLANPITSTINAVRIVRNADGTVRAQHLPDLLTSEDDWFRPVNMEFGPDGCLYIADWYNKIVSHNELPTTHPDRDKTHGRIWRIRHVSQKPREIPNFYEMGTQELAGHLKSPSLWEKRAVWHQITDRPLSETKRLAPEITAFAADESLDELTRIHALWCLEGMGHYDEQLMTSLLKSSSPDLKREAIRSLTSFSLSPSQLSAKVKDLIEDGNPQIRSQVIRTLTEAAAIDPSGIEVLLKACKPELPGNEMGGSYERRFERYLARKALEQYPSELLAYINAPNAGNIPVDHILWAIQALPAAQKEMTFLQFWPKSGITKLDESTFVGIAKMLGNKDIYEMVKPVVQDPGNASVYLNFALQNQSEVQSPELADILLPAVISLMKSGVQADVDLALDAVGRFNMEKGREAVIALINDETPDKTFKLALRALEINPKANQAIFAKAVENKDLSFDIRAESLNSLAKADPAMAQKALEKWIPGLDMTEKADLTRILSESGEGSRLLLNMYSKKLLTHQAFDLSAAERISDSNRKDPRGREMMAVVKKREEEKKKAFKWKLSRYMTIAQKNAGNPENGRLLFQTCLACHQVGGNGQTIAPALDGSASRENEALLTAILDPDAAVESGYSVYRITKKDGSSVEGYLVNKDARGSTLAFMGGGKMFIEAGAIKSQGFLGGRSFMLKGLIDNYSDKQVADLLSYIKTLK